MDDPFAPLVTSVVNGEKRFHSQPKLQECQVHIDPNAEMSVLEDTILRHGGFQRELTITLDELGLRVPDRIKEMKVWQALGKSKTEMLKTPGIGPKTLERMHRTIVTRLQEFRGFRRMESLWVDEHERIQFQRMVQELLCTLEAADLRMNIFQTWELDQRQHRATLICGELAALEPDDTNKNLRRKLHAELRLLRLAQDLDEELGVPAPPTL